MRLIDADKLLETLQDLEPHCNNKKYENGMLIMMRYYMPQIINDEPTAYDVDKVVEELEIERKTANNTYNSFNMDVDLGRVFGLEKAIEIVKSGSTIYEDVCEWKAIGANDNWSTSCDKNSTHNVFGVAWFKRCPYCGRKLKIVGDNDDD